MELPNFNTYMNFSRHQLCCFTIIPLFVLDKSMAWNRCLQHPCFKNLCEIAQAFKNSYSNTQHFLSDVLTHPWFHSMHSQITNSLILSWIGVSTLAPNPFWRNPSPLGNPSNFSRLIFKHLATGVERNLDCGLLLLIWNAYNTGFRAHQPHQIVSTCSNELFSFPHGKVRNSSQQSDMVG
jgi:hypothetical protein